MIIYNVNVNILTISKISFLHIHICISCELWVLWNWVRLQQAYIQDYNKKKRYLKGYDPSHCLIDLKLGWFYISKSTNKLGHISTHIVKYLNNRQNFIFTHPHLHKLWVMSSMELSETTTSVYPRLE